MRSSIIGAGSPIAVTSRATAQTFTPLQPDSRQLSQCNAAEELAEPVSPRMRKGRIVLRPKNLSTAAGVVHGPPLAGSTTGVPWNEQIGVACSEAVADPFWFYKLSQFIPVHQRPTIALAPVASQLAFPKELEDGGPAESQLSSGLIDRDDLRHGLDRTEPCATVRLWAHRCVHL